MPTSVTLVGQRFSLERVSRDHSWLVTSDGTKVGNMRMGKQAIVVSEGLAPDQERDTVLHETLHALAGVIALWDDDKDEERVVGTLTPILLDALRSNPELVTYLTAEAA